MSSEPVYLSKEGRLKLEKDLHHLKFVERPRVVGEISRAMQMGDLSENAEYHAAKEEQKHLERRIGELEDKLARARSVDMDKIPTDKAYLFAKVTVRDLDRKEEVLFQLMPPDETDVDDNRISVKSPIGLALLGKAVGESVEVQVPVGKIRYKILKISRD